MHKIDVNLAQTSYPIYIGNAILADGKLLQQYLTSRQVLVVTDKVVAPLYLNQLVQHLVDVDYDTVVLPSGEETKNLEYFNYLITRLIEKKYSRTCILIALGGGVIGDLTGFVAACYQRGVKFIQVPTTLLAQVDSAVGGKTAVNHRLGKNMIGSFHQPVAVLADCQTLSTLPARQFSAGLAEVIKYGLISDKAFFYWLEENMTVLMERDSKALIYAIERSCINKAKVVGADERETGLRAILNLGHTFGHAIETALAYRSWLHGEAVACGMLMAADLSVRLGLLDAGCVDRIYRLLLRAHLPVKVHPDVTAAQLLNNMKVDKKSVDGVLHLILLTAIGKAIITADYTEQALGETINHFLE